jgi:hypothetical protein
MTTPENRDSNPPMLYGSSKAVIDAALEAKPSVQIPADFAARVAAIAAAQPVRRGRRIPRIARLTTLLLAPVVAVALFALAPHATPNVKSLVFDTEVILLAQLALIGWSFSRTIGAQDSF